MVPIGAENASLTVIEEIGEIVRREPIIEGNQHPTDLRDGIEGFELRVRIRSHVSDSITAANTQPLESRGDRVAYVAPNTDRKSTRLNSSHSSISYAVFC